MDVKDLEIFQTVAKHKSVSKAAAQLNYVQSNVTNRIHKLESELETLLFHRNNRGVVITSAGEILLAYTDKILNLFKEAKEAVKDREMPSGPLSIGATDITTAVRLPSVLSSYHERYPDVHLSLKTGSTDELVNEVLNYNLDGAFITDCIDHPKIVQEPLIEEELVFIMGPSTPKIEKLKDLQKRTILVFRTGCTYRAKLEQWLREEGIFPVKKIEFGTIEGMLGCVKAGLGAALVSRRISKQLKDEGGIVCYPVPEKFKHVTTVFIRRRDVPVPNALEKFLDTTRKCFGESEY
ncbi:LysR family transcriptional regulator [Siminovitchia sp. 179-K 8D1 HS]|uniref:LysR family transcriptional regulator n=1 Tax=Siminovitchia sp. 179-K 8D1 HS TaxID=3142385 RepID=UPI0039A1BAEF